MYREKHLRIYAKRGYMVRRKLLSVDNKICTSVELSTEHLTQYKILHFSVVEMRSRCSWTYAIKIRSLTFIPGVVAFEVVSLRTYTTVQAFSQFWKIFRKSFSVVLVEYSWISSMLSKRWSFSCSFIFGRDKSRRERIEGRGIGSRWCFRQKGLCESKVSE